MKLRIIEAEYHRNGIGGVGCFVVKFKEFGKRDTAKIATFYPEEEEKEFTQVFDPSDINYCYRSYDHFWGPLKEHEEEIEGMAFPNLWANRKES